MLVTPGIVTDVLGLSFMVPPVRRGVARAVMRWLRRRIEVHTVVVGPGFPLGSEHPWGVDEDAGPARRQTVETSFREEGAPESGEDGEPR